MDTITHAIGWAGTGLLAATLAGLVWRGRYIRWYAFTAYLFAVAVFTGLFLAVPALYTEEMWVVHLNVVNVLRFAVAIELAVRTHRSFPGARSTLRPVLLGVLVVTLVVILGDPGRGGSYAAFLREQQPRLLNGTVWLYSSIAGLILWYRLPVSRFQKAVLLSYVPYLFFELVYLHVFVERGWRNLVVGYVNQLAYLVLVAYWTWAAWRVDPARPPDQEAGDDEGHALSRIA